MKLPLSVPPSGETPHRRGGVRALPRSTQLNFFSLLGRFGRVEYAHFVRQFWRSLEELGWRWTSKPPSVWFPQLLLKSYFKGNRLYNFREFWFFGIFSAIFWNFLENNLVKGRFLENFLENILRWQREAIDFLENFIARKLRRCKSLIIFPKKRSRTHTAPDPFIYIKLKENLRFLS